MFEIKNNMEEFLSFKPKMTKALSHDAGANDDDNDAGVLGVLTISRVSVCCSLSGSINKVKYELS
jgi:hypothetical protein